MAPAAFFSEDPGTGCPWWIVTHMLGVATVEIGYPMGLLVLVECSDAASQRDLVPFLNVIVMSAMVEFGRRLVFVLAS